MYIRMKAETTHKLCDLWSGSNFISKVHIFFAHQCSSVVIKWHNISSGFFFKLGLCSNAWCGWLHVRDRSSLLVFPCIRGASGINISEISFSDYKTILLVMIWFLTRMLQLHLIVDQAVSFTTINTLRCVSSCCCCCYYIVPNAYVLSVYSEIVGHCLSWHPKDSSHTTA
jgi:hypothetical protein